MNSREHKDHLTEEHIEMVIVSCVFIRDLQLEINALFDINDLPTALLGFAAFVFNCGVLEQKSSGVVCWIFPQLK
jgi:hypothetical protein